MKEIEYTEEEMTRLHDGILDPPPFPEDLEYIDGNYWSKKYPYYVSYPVMVRNLFRAECIITACKNQLRQMINDGMDEEIINGAFVNLERNLNTKKRIEKDIEEFKQHYQQMIKEMMEE